ncbi:MAG: hypothetical protein ACR2O6_08000 [Ilumatobacteraceae bacterium]
MSTSSPPPFDDGGGLPNTGLDGDAGGENLWPGGSSGGEPNYLIRRALAVAAVVAAVAAIGIVVGRIIDAGDSDPSDAPDAAEWNRAVVVTDDEIRVVDPQTGDVGERYPADEALLDNRSVATGDTFLTVNAVGRVTELDLTDGSIRRFRASEDSSPLVSTDNASIVLIGPGQGGNVFVVDTATETIVDIGRLAGIDDPLMFVDDVLVNEPGTHIAVSDARTFQSVLVDIVAETAVLLAGQVIALDHDTVVTAQRAGAEAELEFYDLAGDRRGSVDAPSPQATMLIDSTTALVVAGDGTIVRASAGGAVDDGGNVGDDEAVDVAGGSPASGSEWLVVSTTDEVVLLDAKGAIVARAPGQLLSPADRPTRCIVVGSALASRTAVHLDLDDGAVLGEIDGGAVTSTSTEGCTVAAGDGGTVVRSGIPVDVDAPTGTLTITPDGGAVVVTTARGARLATIPADDGEDEDADPVRLAVVPAVVHFAQL